VGQPGKITHIVTGCEDTDTGHETVQTHQGGYSNRVVPREEWKREERYPGVTVYFSPATPQAKTFPWFNKAWSFDHWLKHQAPDESIIAIVDPDQWFVRKLTNDPKDADAVLPPVLKPCPLCKGAGAGVSEKVVKSLNTYGVNVVKRGHPVSQIYGLGGKMATFDLAAICGKESDCDKVTDQLSMDFYQVGPPYIMHRDDFLKVIPKWWEFMPATFKQDPHEISVDMYAYTMACAHYDLPHAVLRDYMVSDADCPGKWIYFFSNAIAVT
jgi:hypothetical protein